MKGKINELEGHGRDEGVVGGVGLNLQLSVQLLFCVAASSSSHELENGREEIRIDSNDARELV